MLIVNEDGLQADLPDTLAKLLIENRGWGKAKRRNAQPLTPTKDAADDDVPIPMTHIPGVVPGVSMKRVRKMVEDREVAVYVEGRVKKVKPSDVRAAIKEPQ